MSFSRFTEGSDDVTLDGGDAFNTVDALGGYDTIRLPGEGLVVGVQNVEAVFGSGRNDFVAIGSAGTGVSVYANLGIGHDTVALDDNAPPQGLVNLLDVEEVYGSRGDDLVSLSFSQPVEGPVRVEGAAGRDTLLVRDHGWLGSEAVQVSNVELVVANESTRVLVGAGSDGMRVSGEFDSRITADLSSLQDGVVHRIEVENVALVVGSDSRDVVKVMPGFDPTRLDLGAGIDRVELTGGKANAPVIVTNVEALLGNGGEDTVILTGSTPVRMSIDLAGGRDVLRVDGLAGETRELLVSNAETIIGGEGDESVTLRTAAKGVLFSGNGGFDRLDLANASNSVSVDGVEAVNGGSGIDRIDVRGQEAASLFGNAGGDILSGGAGEDFIMGGTGKDTMTGREGRDTFFFSSIADSDLATRDIITDFRPGEDRLEFVDVHVAGKEFVSQFDFLGSVQKYTGKEFQATGHAQAVFLDTTDQLFLDVDGDGSMDMRMTLQGVDGSQLSATDFGWFSGE